MHDAFAKHTGPRLFLELGRVGRSMVPSAREIGRVAGVLEPSTRSHKPDLHPDSNRTVGKTDRRMVR